MIVLVMGTTGSGKTTIGQMLATRLGWMFLDADDFRVFLERRAGSHQLQLTALEVGERLGGIHGREASRTEAGTPRKPYKHTLCASGSGRWC